MQYARQSGHGDQCGHGFDAVPEVFEAEVFVGGVLVVVVVGDGDGDGTGVGGALHGVQGYGPTGGRQEDDFAAGAFNLLDDIGGDGEVHGSAGGVLAGFGLDEGDPGVGKEFFAGRRGAGDEVSLGANVVDDALLLDFCVDAYYEAEIEVGGGSGWDGGGGARSCLAGGDAVDVERWFVEEVEEVLAAAVGVAEGELLSEEFVVDRGRGQRLFFDGAQGSDAVIEV